MDKRYVDVKTADGIKFRSSYAQIKDTKFKPLGILNLPYIPDDGFYERELRNFLIRLGQVYSIMLIVAFVLAYFLSSYITQFLKSITDKITETRFNQKNEKLNWKKAVRKSPYLSTLTIQWWKNWKKVRQN